MTLFNICEEKKEKIGIPCLTIQAQESKWAKGWAGTISMQVKSFKFRKQKSRGQIKELVWRQAAILGKRETFTEELPSPNICF